MDRPEGIRELARFRPRPTRSKRQRRPPICNRALVWPLFASRDCPDLIRNTVGIDCSWSSRNSYRLGSNRCRPTPTYPPPAESWVIACGAALFLLASPLVGEGRGWGSRSGGRPCTRGTTPHPGPPPQGGR